MKNFRELREPEVLLWSFTERGPFLLWITLEIAQYSSAIYKKGTFIAWNPSYVLIGLCPAYSSSCKRNTGPPGLPCSHYIRHAMVSDPRDAAIILLFNGDSCVDFHRWKNVVLPITNITGLNSFNLTDYSLTVCCPTHKSGCYHPDSKDLLPGGWPAFQGGSLTR